MHGQQIRSGGSAALLLAVSLVAAAGCATTDNLTSTTPPANGTPCAGASDLQLDVNQSARVDCSAGTQVTLTGGGASYLVVPNLASGEPLPDNPTAYTISATGAAVANVLPTTSAAAVAAVTGAWANLLAGRGPGALQRRFESALQSVDARKVASGQWNPARSLAAAAARASVQAATPPAVGSLRTFHVISSLDTVSFKFARVTARLQYAGSDILLYVDTAAPAGGFTTTQLANFAQTFDQVLYPIDVNAFGPPSDIDQNGRLIMLLTPVVNHLTPSAQCASQGYIAGFFSGNDLANTDTTSNQGEVFYALVPDAGATVSCAHTASDLEATLGSTFLHEFQHLINFSQHVLVHNSNPEEGWLDEGLSLVAEELGSLYYEQKYPPPAGRSNPAQIFPDSAEPYIGDLLLTSYDYLTGTDTTTLTLHSDDQTGLNWRGGDWLLLHYLGDQNGGASFYQKLEQTGLTGIPNIEAAAGQPFTMLFGNFSAALYTDSLPGVPRSQIPAQDRFTTRDLRQLYARLAATGSVTNPFPLAVTPLTTASQTGSLVPGSMAFYHLTTSAATVTITFSAPGGGTLPLAAHPQLTIYRLPPGL